MPALIPELYCTSLAQNCIFYVSVLGFEILYERPEEKFVMLKLGEAQIMLQEQGAAREWISAPMEKPLGCGVNFQIQVSGVEALYAKAQQAGAAIFLPLEEKWYRVDGKIVGNHQFIVQDPDGYLLRFFEDLGEKG